MHNKEEIEKFRQEKLPEYMKYIEKTKDSKLTHKPTHKRCKICGKVKVLSAFYKHPLKRLGRFDECKICLKKRRELKKCKIT